MVIKSLQELYLQKEEYQSDIFARLIEKSPKVAYHFNCTDGTCSAAIIRALHPNKELLFLPIDHPLFNDTQIGPLMKEIEWFAILDLPPFSNKKIGIYVDHHISVAGQPMRADTIHFVAGAPSATNLLYLTYQEKLPVYLKEVAEITKITDTASYKIAAPMELKTEWEDYSWDEKVWFLEDACKTAYRVEEHDELIQILATEGINGLWKKTVLDRIIDLREYRKGSWVKANEIEIEEFIILIDDPLSYNLPFIAHELMHKGAIGTSYLTVYPENVKISFRLNKKLSENEIERYRTDILAKKMGGGGHKPASGAQAHSLEYALEMIQEWAKNMGFKTKIVDLRK